MKNTVLKIPARLSILLVSSCMLAACNSGRITRVEIDSATRTVCDSTFNTPCGVLDTQPVTVRVWGVGKCDSVGVKMGDGSTLYSPYQHDFGKTGSLVPFEVTHTYGYSWPGVKTIHAYSKENCMGEARETIQVMRKIGTEVHSELDFNLALPYFQGNGPAPGPCMRAFDVHNVRNLRPNTKVTVTAKPDPNNKINFGCFLGGCIYGVDGEAGTAAAAPFPFVGMSKYSMVLRVGNQVVQGGSQTSFTTTGTGSLEICVNDDILPDNTGTWKFTISVDESQSQ